MVVVVMVVVVMVVVVVKMDDDDDAEDAEMVVVMVVVVGRRRDAMEDTPAGGRSGGVGDTPLLLPRDGGRGGCAVPVAAVVGAASAGMSSLAIQCGLEVG